MIDLWKKRLPIDDDLKGSKYKLFHANNFIHVLDGIGFYKPNKFIKKQHSFLPKTTLNEVQNYLDNILNKKYINSSYKTHKQIIKNINK